MDILPDSFIKSPTPTAGVRGAIKSIGLNSLYATSPIDYASGKGHLEGRTSAHNTEFLGS